MMVVDASVVVKWFVPEQGHQAARQLLTAQQAFVAPDFVILETINVLRRKYKRGDMNVTLLEQVAGALDRYFAHLMPARQLIAAAVDLAVVIDHDLYDCAYLACAIQQSVPLVTADDVFGSKAIAHGFGGHVLRL